MACDETLYRQCIDGDDEGLDALMAAAALNANHNLMVTRLCTLLRRQAGR